MPHDPSSRADGFYSDLSEARENDRPSAVVAALGRVAGDEECSVDEPLREAIERRLIVGTVPLLRCDLAGLVRSAEMEAAVLYARRLARAEWEERQRKARQSAAALLEFAVHALKDREELQQASTAMRDTPWAWEEADHAAAEHELVELDHLISRSRNLAKSISAHAEKPLPEVGGGPNTDHQAVRYFRALRDWWDASAVDPTQRGAKATRNRIAAALWRDLGRPIPDSYSDQDWAKDRFGES